MIDMGKILGGAKAGAEYLTMPEFRIGMGYGKKTMDLPAGGAVFNGGYTLGSMPEGNPGRAMVMNTDPERMRMVEGSANSPYSIGGASRTYVPEQDMFRSAGVAPTTLPEDTPQEVLGASPQPQAQMPEPQAHQGTEEQEAAIEAMVKEGSAGIPQLLEALKAMASMGPKGNPVFQFDAEYKNSSATGGVPGTVAQYPSAGGNTRETDYYL